MLDLKTVKNITISEGSVTKITNSSGVVLWQKVVAPSASLDIDLNNQWVDSTKTLDGYNVYMSNSNKGVNNGYASMKFKFKGMPDFKLWINSYAESNYDYTVAWNMDVNYPTSNPSSNSTGVKAHTYGKQYDPTSISNFTEVDYPNDGGEHFVVVTYRKDSSVNSNDDRGYVAVKLTLISTTWVVSATEFIKKDGKYYEKLTEVGTYTDGSTALTGNYKEGNELAVTYKQGSADDYIVNDGKKYYKNYIYVTPKDQEINTGDYIQGDYIGEATPSMKVTYVDGTEKTFYDLTSIESDTDSNKKNSKNVVIYDGVTKIGIYTFYDCSKLTGITIPDSVTEIGDSAFLACSELTGITIPSGVTSISKNVFQGCSSLTGITIPSEVTEIGKEAFNACTSLIDITIPNSVTNIGSSAFRGCSSLTGITIPSGVTNIETHTFDGCKNLTSVVIPDSVTIIGEYAFYGCTSLIDITIPNSVTNIGSSAFRGCSSLTGITIPSGVTSIGIYTFDGCKNLTSVVIPDSVTIIGSSAFQGCSSLTGITIPSGVTSIEYNAFQDCVKLAEVTFENSTSKLNYFYGSFVNISPSAKLYVPSNLLSQYQSDSDWTGAFGGGIYEIQIPAMKVTYVDGTEKTFNNLTSIGSGTDSNKANAKNVVIYDSVTKIDDYAFRSCTNLENVIFSNSLKSIGQYAFYNCYSLTSVTIHANVTTIGDSAFGSCSGLTNVTIENSNAKLTYNSLAFSNISSTEAILFVPSSLLADYKADSGWTGAFKAGIYAIGTTPTPSVTVICTDNSVKKLYNLTTINSNTNLYKNIAKEVVIGDSITSIGYRSFYSFTALTSVTISNSVTSIGEGAFEFCGNLTGITIPNSVTSIGNDAFLGCSIIKDLIIPNSVTGIGSKAFQTCHALESVTIQNSNKKLTYWNNAFDNIPSTAKLYVPSNLLSDYQSDSSWKNAFKGGIYAIPS